MIMRYMWLLVLACSMISAGQSHLRVIVPSYNNAQWCEKNLQSIFEQSDQNYELYYIDDASTDGTGDLVEAYVRTHGKEKQVHIIRNEYNRGALANIYWAVHQCPDDAVVAIIDGDDWLYDNQVFSRINTAYQDANVWMTYGQFMQYPSNTVGFCRVMPEEVIRHNAYREYDWITSHLRTFYAGLFKRIKLQDLLDEHGRFFTASGDLAWMFPLLEMAGKHVRYISEVQYVYNQANPLNDFRKKFIEQIHCDRLIRSRSKYWPIKNVLQKKNNDSSVCVIGLYGKEKDHTLGLLNNLQAHIWEIKERCAMHIDSENGLAQLRDIVEKTDCAYVLLLEEESFISDDTDLRRCIALLEQTSAHAFYFNILRVGAGLCKHDYHERPAGTTIQDDIFAWQFKHGSFGWRLPYQFGGVLYRKDDLHELLMQANRGSIRAFFLVMNLCVFDMNGVGLCFDTLGKEE